MKVMEAPGASALVREAVLDLAHLEVLMSP